MNCDVLIKQSLAEDSKIGEAIRSFMDKRMEGRTSIVEMFVSNLAHMGYVYNVYEFSTFFKIVVPDDLILQLLKNRLSQLDCISHGWVLHAFPTTRRQAEGLTNIGFEPNR